MTVTELGQRAGSVELVVNPSHIVGPTWQKLTDGSWYLPEYSLGWGILNWLADYVKSPGGESAGEAFLPTLEQARFLLWWYAVDEDGKYTYKEGVLRRLKGWGKDPLAAAMALAELSGPVAFSHFDEHGSPVGKPRHAAWVQVSAVSIEQTKNTFSLFPVMISSAMKAEYGLDVNKTIIYSAAGGRIESVTSSPASMEGNRPTFVIRNEALALDTRLPTPEGWTTVGTVEPGDWLIAPDGQPVEVEYVTPVQTDRSCYRVSFEDGTSVVTSDGHLWLTKVSGSAAEPKIRTTQQIADDGRRFRIPRADQLHTDDVELPVDPYALGVWLGDGDKGSGIVCASAEDAAETRRHLESQGFTTTLCKPSRDLVRFNVSTNTGLTFRGMLREAGILNNKHVPDVYLRAGTAQRTALLQGLMDTDGCASSDGRAIFVNSNEKIIRSFEEITRSLGQVPHTAWVNDPRSRTGGYYRVSFTPRNLNPFRMERKVARVKPHGVRSDWQSITSIVPVDSVPVKCVRVKSDDHLFLIGDGWNVTHNTQWWIESVQGHDMAGVIEGNVTKITGSRILSICNGHVPGQESVAELDYQAWQAVEAGQAVDTGVLYDALEAPADTPVSEIPPISIDPVGHEAGIQKLREGIRIARGDATWLDIDKILSSILDVRNPITESRRKFLNQINAAEDAWISPAEWARCEDLDLKLAPKEKITLGFDGSKSNDHTALVACRLSDGALFVLGHWNPLNHKKPDGSFEVPRDEVDATVRSAFTRYEVVAMRADVKEFESYVDSWSRDYKKKIIVNASPTHPIAFDMRGNQKRFALDCEKFYDAVVERELRHDGNRLLRQHTLNAVRHPTNYDAISIRKASKDSSRKIDVAVCGVLAFGARQEVLMSKLNRSRKVVVYA